MKHRLNEIFNEAIQDTYAITLNGREYESRMVYGVKIIRDKKSKSVEIINTAQGGGYYRRLSSEELSIFLEKGWRNGVYLLSLSNYRSKLDLIEGRIKKEMNGRASVKQIGLLKNQRERVLSRYSEINYKLNKLNQINYGNSKDSKGSINL
tara:strand:- start:247 stop:699 length:453 start_codon:yes stop_codon:yes gene_type:complete